MPVAKCLAFARSRSLGKIGIFAAFAIILAPMVIYCLIQMLTAYSMYRQQVKAIDDNKPKNKMVAHLSLLSPTNDNNDPSITMQEADLTPPDEFGVITQAIQNSFAGYKDYNTTMTNYYQNVRKESPPDLMDSSVLTPEGDDW